MMMVMLNFELRNSITSPQKISHVLYIELLFYIICNKSEASSQPYQTLPAQTFFFNHQLALLCFVLAIIQCQRNRFLGQEIRTSDEFKKNSEIIYINELKISRTLMPWLVIHCGESFASFVMVCFKLGPDTQQGSIIVNLPWLNFFIRI